jgi:tetratricopeptide (TPR) repeat protein
MKNKSSLLVKYLNLYKQKPTSRVFAPLAESYRKIGMINEAFDVLSQGLKYHPDYVLGHLVLANCYFDKKSYQKAFDTIQPYVADNIDNLSLQKLFAEICLKVGKLEDALQTYKYLLFLNPREPEFIKKVHALEDDLRVGETIAEDLSYKQLYPDDWKEVNFHHVDLKTVDEQKVESEKPQKSKISEVFNNNDLSEFKDKASELKEEKAPVVTHTLVDLYLEQKYYDKALEILHKILELNPDDEKTLLKVKEVEDLINRGDFEEEGHENLLNIIDQKVKKTGPLYEDVASKFSHFLQALRHKASTV